jgi:hypothetical protein
MPDVAEVVSELFQLVAVVGDGEISSNNTA